MQFRIEPKWQPIETAPKDRPIWLSYRNLEFETGKERTGHVAAYWGIMQAYPDHGEMWIPVGRGDNSSYQDDLPFRKEISIYDDHGFKREMTRWRGNEYTHWADIIDHTVMVVGPSEYVFPAYIETKVTDRT